MNGHVTRSNGCGRHPQSAVSDTSDGHRPWETPDFGLQGSVGPRPTPFSPPDSSWCFNSLFNVVLGKEKFKLASLVFSVHTNKMNINEKKFEFRPACFCRVTPVLGAKCLAGVQTHSRPFGGCACERRLSSPKEREAARHQLHHVSLALGPCTWWGPPPGSRQWPGHTDPVLAESHRTPCTVGPPGSRAQVTSQMPHARGGTGNRKYATCTDLLCSWAPSTVP